MPVEVTTGQTEGRISPTTSLMYWTIQEMQLHTISFRPFVFEPPHPHLRLNPHITPVWHNRNIYFLWSYNMCRGMTRWSSMNPSMVCKQHLYVKRSRADYLFFCRQKQRLGLYTYTLFLYLRDDVFGRYETFLKFPFNHHWTRLQCHEVVFTKTQLLFNYCTFGSRRRQSLRLELSAEVQSCQHLKKKTAH